MKNSFTLIELIIVVLIITIFSTLSFAFYNDFNQQTILKSEEKRLISVIELARKKAYSSDLYDPSCSNFLGYQVSIDSSGSSYSLLFNCNGIFQTLASYYPSKVNVTISPTSVDIVFPPLGVGTNISTPTITLKNTVINKCINITINQIGVTDSNEVLVSC